MARWLQTPSRQEFRRLVDWWERETRRLGVTMRLSETATASSLASDAPDLVVVATGSAPVLRPVSRSNSAITEVGPYDSVPPGGHVVVRDEMGGFAALLTAERLTLTCDRVTLVTSLLHPGEGEGLTLYPLLRDCGRRGVTIIDRARVTAIEGRTVRLGGVFAESRPPIEDVDAVVSVLDSIADADLAAALAAGGMRVVTIGDCRLPRDVTAAVADASRLFELVSAA